MNNIKEFTKEWGIAILLLFALLIFFNTCGTKGKIERLDKKVQSMEKANNHNDSLSREINSIEREINICETAKEVLYFENAVVRQITRPDDLINEYDKKIKILRAKLDKTKNGGK